MNGVCTVCVSGRAEVAHITLIYEMLPYRVTGKSALAHVELGIEEMHPPPLAAVPLAVLKEKLELVIEVVSIPINFKENKMPPPALWSPTTLLLLNEQWSTVAPVQSVKLNPAPPALSPICTYECIYESMNEWVIMRCGRERSIR